MNLKNSKGLTLAELLLASAILVFALCGTLAFFVNCSFLNESNRNLTTAMSHAEYVMEEIRSEQDLAALQSIIDDGSLTQFSDLPTENITVCHWSSGSGTGGGGSSEWSSIKDFGSTSRTLLDSAGSYSWTCSCSNPPCSTCSASSQTASDPLGICVKIDWKDRGTRARSLELVSAMTDYAVEPVIEDDGGAPLDDGPYTPPADDDDDGGGGEFTLGLGEEGEVIGIQIDFVDDDDTCCFLAGTKITMADATLKDIEEVEVGDIVRSFNLKTQQLQDNKVLELESPIREGYYTLYFGDDQKVGVTNEHPFYTKKPDGSILWCSIEPEKTYQYHPALSFVRKLEAGDMILTDKGTWTKVNGWDYNEGQIQTYNLSGVENTNTFFANSLLAHNKGIGGSGSPYTPPGDDDGPDVDGEDISINTEGQIIVTNPTGD